jgi:hypothetical protein
MTNPHLELTGGYAFPNESMGGSGFYLLDYFASKAMAGLIARREEPAKIAQTAYDLAEGMVAEHWKRLQVIRRLDEAHRKEAAEYH